ncbi:MAG: hypothetical protein ACR2JW_17930 [Thermomicrobiales bacterium]
MTPSYPPPPPPPPVTMMPPIPRASRGRVMRRGVRRFFTSVGTAVRIIFSGRPILVGCLLLLLPLAGWLMYDRMFASHSSASSGTQTVVRLPEVPVVQTYIKAVQTGDADAAWGTLSPTEKARRVSRNEGKSVLMQAFQLEQQSKMTYSAVHYTGSYDQTSSGNVLYFYVGDVGTGTQTRIVPLLFSVDKNGTIAEVDDVLYNNALAQLMGGP